MLRASGPPRLRSRGTTRGVSSKLPLRDCKLVILIGHFGRGGCERQAYLLAQSWRQRHGLDVEVWSLIYGGHDEAYAKEFEAAGIPVRVVGFDFPNSYFRPVRHIKW